MKYLSAQKAKSTVVLAILEAKSLSSDLFHFSIPPRLVTSCFAHPVRMEVIHSMSLSLLFVDTIDDSSIKSLSHIHILEPLTWQSSDE